MRRLIIITIIVIGVGVWLSIADSILFDFYQESTANKWANFGSIPILIYLLVTLIKDRWKSSLKEGKERIMQTIKYAFGGGIAFGLLYVVFLTPAISSSILLVNFYIGEQTDKQVVGVIEKKTAFSMQRGGKYELLIKVNNEQSLALETNGKAIKNYDLGDTFNESMKIGSLGLLTKIKTNR